MWHRFASTRTYYPSSVFLIFLVPALSDFLFGYDIGATSYSILFLRDDPQSIGFVVSATSAGAFGTSFLVFKVADQIGRRKELQISSLLYFVASLIEAASGWLSNNKYILILGRIIYGAGIAFGLHGASTYAGEMLPSSLRGACMSCQEVSLVLGILVGYAVGSWNETRETWLLLYLFAAPCAIVMFILSICVIPDSARWLLWKRQAHVEAKRALEFVYKPSHVDMELTELTQRLVVAEPNSSLQRQQQQQPHFRKHARSLIAGLGLVTLLQLTGQPTLLSYAASIFGSSTTVWVAVWKVIWTLVAASWVEHFGRKSLLYAGCTIMLLSLLVLSVCINSTKNHNLSIGAFFLYILGYQIGFGTMIFVLSLELYPMEIRGPAVAMSIQLNMALNALVQFITPLLVHVGGGYGCVFGFFSMACAYALYFIYKYIPETKGMTLEEIQEFLLDEDRISDERNEEQESILTTRSRDS